MATPNQFCPKCNIVLRLLPQPAFSTLMCVRCGYRSNQQQQQPTRKGHSFSHRSLDSKCMTVQGVASSGPDLPLVCKNVTRLLRRSFFRRGQQQTGLLPPLQVLGNAGSLNTRSKNTPLPESKVLPVPHLTSVKRRDEGRRKQGAVLDSIPQHSWLPPLQRPPQAAVMSDSIQRKADGGHLCLPEINHQV